MPSIVNQASCLCLDGVWRCVMLTILPDCCGNESAAALGISARFGDALRCRVNEAASAVDAPKESNSSTADLTHGVKNARLHERTVGPRGSVGGECLRAPFALPNLRCEWKNGGMARRMATANAAQHMPMHK